MADVEPVLPADTEADDVARLGSVVLRARRLSVAEMSRRRGDGRLGVVALTVGYALLATFPVALLLAGAMLARGWAADPRAWGPALIGAFLLGWAACAWAFVRRPSKASLVLHERDLRFRGEAFAFDRVAAIREGWEGSPSIRRTIALNRMIGRVRPEHLETARQIESALAETWVVTLRDDTTRPLKGLLSRYDRAAVDAIFRWISERHPAILWGRPGDGPGRG